MIDELIDLGYGRVGVFILRFFLCYLSFSLCFLYFSHSKFRFF